MEYLLLRTLFAAAFGLVIGCCANTLEYRLRCELTVTDGSCYCPECRHKLPIYDQIPVISYLILSGRCRYCKSSISPRYPAVEASAMLIYALTAFLTAQSTIAVPLLGLLIFCGYAAASMLLRRVKPTAGKIASVFLTMLWLNLLVAVGMLLLNAALL